MFMYYANICWAGQGQELTSSHAIVEVVANRLEQTFTVSDEEVWVL